MKDEKVMKSVNTLSPSELYEQACQIIMHQNSTVLGYGWVEGSRSDYWGMLSRTTRQIDATIHLPDEQRVLVECKRWMTAKIDVQDVESFDAKVRFDLGYEGAMMVSCLGFTHGAVNYAKSRNIGLVTLNANATLDEYIMKMDAHLLVGVVETALVSEEVFSCQLHVTLEPETALASDEMFFHEGQ